MNLNNIEFDIKIINDSFYRRMFETNKVDQECDKIREIIINERNKLKGITLNKCVITKDILYHKDRLWVPESMYTFTIQEIHDQFTCDHFEIERTYELFKREYYWKNMRITMIIYIANCYICKKIKTSRNREHDLLQSLPISQKRW